MSRRPRTRLLIVSLVLIVGVAVAGLVALQRSSIARRQGQFFYGLPEIRFWLTGEEVTTPITDWSFADPLPALRLQTHTWYLVPYSVSVWFARSGDDLYLYSNYAAPQPGQPDLRDRFPEARAWNRNLLRDPRCRVQIGDKVINCVAHHLTDAKDVEVAREALYIRYPQLRQNQTLPEARRARHHFWRIVPQWS